MTEHNPAPRPPSPWPGSRYETRHRWQLDGVRSLDDAASHLRRLAAELTAADAAGWWLVEPMRSGHLLAARASRRQRDQLGPAPREVQRAAAPTLQWRLRLIEEPPLGGDEVFQVDTAAAARTSVLAWVDGALRQVAGPALSSELLADVSRQLTPTDLGPRRWGVAPARVGPSVDLVVDGSALRMHALRDGALVRTHETLTFQHAADRAATLLEGAAAYERLAWAADAMAAAGGRLVGVDDGLLHIGYRRT